MKLSQVQKLSSEEKIWSIDWHPSMNVIASVGGSKTITLWKQLAGKWHKTQTIITEHEKTIRSVSFSHSGQKIAIGSFDALISVWVLAEGTYECLSTMEGHENQIKCVNWSPNDKKIVSCSRDKNIFVWQFDEISFEYVCENVLEGHTQDVKSVNFITNQKIISASYDNTLRIWEMEDDDYICKQILQGHKSIVWSFCFRENLLFSVSQDRSVIVWENEEGTYKLKNIFQEMHSQPIYTCTLHQQYLITGSGDNSLKIVNPVSGQVLCQQKHENDVNCVRAHENQIVSCSDDQTIRIWTIQ